MGDDRVVAFLRDLALVPGTQAPELRKAIGDKLLTPVWMPRRTEIIESQECVSSPVH